MRFFLLALTLAALAKTPPAVAQRPAAGREAPGQPKVNRPAPAAPRTVVVSVRGARMACTPLAGQVFDPNGQPLVGATLLIKGTRKVYLTDVAGRFRLTEPVYEGQTLTVQAAGFIIQEVPIVDCMLPRLVLTRAPDARMKRSGKRAGQVTRMGRSTL